MKEEEREMKVDRTRIECIIVWPEAGERVLLAASYRVTRSQRVRFLPRMPVTSSGFVGNCGKCRARKKRQIKHPNHLAA